MNDDIKIYAREVIDDTIGQYVCGNTLLFEDRIFRQTFDFIITQNITTDETRLYICYLHLLHSLMFGIYDLEKTTEDMQIAWNIYKKSITTNNLDRIEDYVNNNYNCYRFFWLFPTKSLKCNTTDDLIEFMNDELAIILKHDYTKLFL